MNLSGGIWYVYKDERRSVANSHHVPKKNCSFILYPISFSDISGMQDPNIQKLVITLAFNSAYIQRSARFIGLR